MSKFILLLVAFPGLLLFAAAAAVEPAGAASLLLLWLVIFVLVLINGFFVASEFAIIGVRPGQMEEQTRAGSGAAQRVLSILNSPTRQDSFIATAQLGITVASLGLGMYGEPQIAHLIEPYLAQWLGSEPDPALVTTLGYLIAVTLLTYIHIVVGEMVPKSIALSAPARSALAVAGPMTFIQQILYWPVRALNSVGALLLRLFRVPPAQGQDRLHTPEEIRLIVEASTEHGLLNLSEEELIRNIFDFGDRHVGQVMTPRTKVQAISCDMSYAEMKQFVTASRHSRFPVYEDDLDHIIGILHLKDLVRYELDGSGSGPFDLRKAVRAAPAVPEAVYVSELLDDFRRRRLHMAIVLDEFGGLAGIVTLEDLVEEVVGEVRDEFDQEKEPLELIEPGLLEVAGNFLVEDLITYGLDLGDEDDLPDVDTVGGLIITWLGRPPLVADTVKHKEITFNVTEIDGMAVGRATIEFPPSMLEDDD